MSNSIHIVCHEIPWPARHGGLIDILYKIVWLNKIGFQIKLHCYVTNKKTATELEKYCQSVHYYERKTGLQSVSLTLPYIVKSRSSKELEQNLLKDGDPIIFEGMHTTYPLLNPKFNNRKTFVRLFNVETKYYNSLADAEHNFLKKLYYRTEARLLKKYEKKIASISKCWALSTTDQEYFEKEYNATNARFLPVFIAQNEVTSLPGDGTYCLYHGNLQVSENIKAVQFLAKEIFNSTGIELIIAGRNPDRNILNLQRQENLKVIANPTDAELEKLIREAHINILPSFNTTGVKLKLINALYLGRHCLVNDAGVSGSGLYDLCSIAEDASSFKLAVHNMMEKPFTQEDILHRKKFLENLYNNEKNARWISEQVR